MVVQKLEAQHDAGSIEPAGGDDENIRLTRHRHSKKYTQDKRDAFKDHLNSGLKLNRYTENHTVGAAIIGWRQSFAEPGNEES